MSAKSTKKLKRTLLLLKITIVRINPHGLFPEMPVVCSIPGGLRTDRYALWHAKLLPPMSSIGPEPCNWTTILKDYLL